MWLWSPKIFNITEKQREAKWFLENWSFESSLCVYTAILPNLFRVFLKREWQRERIANLALASELDPFFGSQREANQSDISPDCKV